MPKWLKSKPKAASMIFTSHKHAANVHDNRSDRRNLCASPAGTIVDTTAVNNNMGPNDAFINYSLSTLQRLGRPFMTIAQYLSQLVFLWPGEEANSQIDYSNGGLPGKMGKDSSIETHGCAEAHHIFISGFTHEVSSRVPALRKIIPGITSGAE